MEKPIRFRGVVKCEGPFALKDSNEQVTYTKAYLIEESEDKSQGDLVYGIGVSTDNNVSEALHFALTGFLQDLNRKAPHKSKVAKNKKK